MSWNNSIGNAGFEVLAKVIISEQGQAGKGGKSIALRKLTLSGCSINNNKLIAFANVLPNIEIICHSRQSFSNN